MAVGLRAWRTRQAIVRPRLGEAHLLPAQMFIHSVDDDVKVIPEEALFAALLRTR